MKNQMILNILIGTVMVAGLSHADQLTSVPQGIPAPAIKPVVRHEMNLSMLKTEDGYNGYLSDVKAPQVGKSLNAELFDSEITNEMTSKYKAFADTYELKKDYHLNSNEDQVRYETSNKDLVDWTMKKMLQFHVDNSVKRVPQDSAAGKVVGTAYTTANKIQNTQVSFGESTKAKIKLDVPKGSMKVGFTSPIVNSSIDYKARPSSAGLGSSSEEKLSVNMDKDIKPLRASTNASYGLINQSLNYGVNKHLFGPVSAGVGQNKNLRDSSKNETVGRVNFGISF